jgi:phenylacetic acid degradation protein PaaD
MGELTDDLRERLDVVLRDIGFGRLVGVEVVDWDHGRARTRLVPGPEQTNVHGFVHGGALFAVADTAFEVACNSWGRVCVGLDVTVHYAAPAQPGDLLVAEAVEVTRSRRVASYRVEVKGEDGLAPLHSAGRRVPHRSLAPGRRRVAARVAGSALAP